MKLFVAVSLWVGLGGSAFGQGGLFGPYFKTVSLNTKASGAGVATDVANFPLLVRLDASQADEIFSQAAATGGDIRVTNLAGTDPLSFEIESWNKAEKKATLWVLVPLVKGNDSSASFRIYWGREGALSLSSPSDVFDTAKGFQAVWHMNGSVGDELDATVNGFTASAVNGPTDTLGAIGGARKLNGIDHRFTVSNSASGKLNFQLTDSYTLSAWVHPRAITTLSSNGHAIIDKTDNQYELQIYGGGNPKYWDLITRANGAFFQTSTSSDSLPAESAVGSWHLVSAIHRGAPIGGVIAETLYVDGVPINGISNVYTSNSGRNLNFNVHLGTRSAGTAPGTSFSRFWNGMLDEIRISNVARSAAWIKLSYETQKPGSPKTVKVGATPVNVLTAPEKRQAPLASPLRVTRSGTGLLFTFEESLAARAALTLSNPSGRILWRTNIDLRATRTVTWDRNQTPPGIYSLRITLIDPAGKALRTLNQKIPVMD